MFQPTSDMNSSDVTHCSMSRLICWRAMTRFRVFALVMVIILTVYVISELRHSQEMNSFDEQAHNRGRRVDKEPKEASERGANGKGDGQGQGKNQGDANERSHPVAADPLTTIPDGTLSQQDHLDLPAFDPAQIPKFTEEFISVTTHHGNDTVAELQETPLLLTPDDLVYYKKDTRIVWLGGSPGGGTTLLRVMLDIHPDIRCGEDTHVVQAMTALLDSTISSSMKMALLNEAHITKDILEDALGAYLLAIISRQRAMAPVFCTQELFLTAHTTTLVQVFPQSRVLLLIRDARAVCYSLRSRRVPIPRFDTSTVRACLHTWDRILRPMVEQCAEVGPESCMMLYYEQLVLHPRATMEEVLQFVGVPWDERVLHHELAINQTDEIALSGTEAEKKPLFNPVNSISLTAWVRSFPDDHRDLVATLAPLMVELGYDIENYPPVYGNPDDEVARANEALKDQINPNTGLLGNDRTFRKPESKGDD